MQRWRDAGSQRSQLDIVEHDGRCTGLVGGTS
jgi:hypothetical protein